MKTLEEIQSGQLFLKGVFTDIINTNVLLVFTTNIFKPKTSDKDIIEMATHSVQHNILLLS